MTIHTLIDELKQMLDKLFSICSSHSMPEVLECCLLGQQELSAPLKIAIVGTTSVGKSTLLNALVKRDIVPTGAETLTYNVNVLRHVSRSPNKQEVLIAHLKNGLFKEYPISFMSTLVDGRDDKTIELRESILWVEAYLDFDYLKDIDLIDTPGLLSTKGNDSDNTIDLFNDDMRKPDVFVYLMQRAVQKTDIEAVTAFQQSLTKNSRSKVSGLNTVAALTHCDYLCKGDFSMDFHSMGLNLLENNREQYASFRSCFSKAFTLAAIYAESAYKMTDADFSVLQNLTKDLYDEILDDLYTRNDFINDQSVFGKYISSLEDRMSFVHRMEMTVIKYSVWWLKQHPQADLARLKEQLIRLSGVPDMDNYLFSNFKRLAVYFKAVKLVSNIRKSIENVSSKYLEDDIRDAYQNALITCRTFEVKLLNAFSFLTVLVDYYNHSSYFNEKQWSNALRDIDECMSASPNTAYLIGQLSYWEKERLYFRMISEIEAQESCNIITSQIQALL